MTVAGLVHLPGKPVDAPRRREIDSRAGASHPAFLRCSATTVVKMPPRTKNFAVSRMKRGAVAFTRSSRISLVTASWNLPSLRNDQM